MGVAPPPLLDGVLTASSAADRVLASPSPATAYGRLVRHRHSYPEPVDNPFQREGSRHWFSLRPPWEPPKVILKNLGDNLHGLPAMLLLAGARSIIGTLWAVRSDVAEFFFTKLYESLALDTSRLDAFREAQQATRAKFLEARHWAPFYFAGDWH